MVYTKVSAGVWLPIRPIPAEAEIGPIGGQTPAEALVYTTFLPKLHLFTTPVGSHRAGLLAQEVHDSTSILRRVANI